MQRIRIIQPDCAHCRNIASVRFAWILTWVSLVLLPVAVLSEQMPLQAAEVAEAAASSEDIESDVARAQEWIDTPALEEGLVAFSPVADIRYRQYTRPRPLRLWIARVDLSNPSVRCVVTEPEEFPGEDTKFETRSATTLQFARQHGVQLAINTSAFDPYRMDYGMPMEVVGLAAFRGEMFSELYQPENEILGGMYISRAGRIQLKGPPLKAGEKPWHIVPGFRMLIDDGEIVVKPSVSKSGFGKPHQRTAVGVDQTGQTLWIVVADGRLPGISEGMSPVELACLFKNLGVWDALNLDGGGSSTLVLENSDRTHSVINAPIAFDKPGVARHVAANLGIYLPGNYRPNASEEKWTLRDELIRLAATRRGSDYKRLDTGAIKDIVYDGTVVVAARSETTSNYDATFEAFLDAYCMAHYGSDCTSTKGRWFENWPPEKFRAFQSRWSGNEGTDTHVSAKSQPPTQGQYVLNALTWAGIAKRLESDRLLQRGDFVHFCRHNGTQHTAVFWHRDFDDTGRQRLWYWSSQPNPRYAYAHMPGMTPVKTPGCGLNWEYLGAEIDPTRVFGARLTDNADGK